MDYRELLRVALRALRANKLRSFLTLLGVIIGVSTIVGVVGVISGLDNYVKDQLATMAPDVFVVDKFGLIRSREEFLQAVKRPQIRWGDYERLMGAGLQHTSEICATGGRSMKVVNGAKQLPNVNINGVTANFGDMFRLQFDAGGFFTAQEDQAAQAVAVIGDNTKEELFPSVDAMGRVFTINGLPFRVIGVMPKQGRGIGFGQDNEIYIPMQVYRNNFMPSNESIQLMVKAVGGVNGLDASQDEVRAILRALRHTAYKDPDPFGIFTQDTLKQLWRSISTAAFVLLILISSVSLGVGGIVIMNIMLVSVVERTQEIGVRMAMGARKWDILRQFLLEAALLSLVGGLIGIGLGSLGVILVKAAFGVPAQVTALIVGMGIFLAVGVGVAAGFLPAWRASRLLVIDALRAE
ncbi:MAG TPA: ABC transporter permease [Holophagaceae bacterium]|jgi:putative ABC transport system permease protein|nr:ABC transporter permease [Holophagaceae bacterium]